LASAFSIGGALNETLIGDFNSIGSSVPSTLSYKSIT
jgi:hypothetical protein